MANENEAKLWAVQTFHRYEMNIKSNVEETFKIVNIFQPADTSWDRLYVIFSSVTTVNSVFAYTRLRVNFPWYLCDINTALCVHSWYLSDINTANFVLKWYLSDINTA